MRNDLCERTAPSPATPANPTAFGARFVACVQRIAGMKGVFTYHLLKELRRADREATLAILRPHLDAGAIRAVRETNDPAALAASYRKLKRKADTREALLWGLLAGAAMAS